MDKDFDLEIDELRKEVAEDLRPNRGNRDGRHVPAALQPEKRSLLFAVIGILAVVAAIVLFLGRGNGTSVEDLKAMEVKLADLEKKWAKVEVLEEKIADLERQIRKLGGSLSELRRPVISKRPEARYHEVRRGETLSEIAKAYDLALKDLCRLNQITPKTIIRPGQRLLISSGG
jgi:cell division protein FtsB